LPRFPDQIVQGVAKKNLLVKPDSWCTVGKRAELNGYLELNCFEPSLTGSKAMCAWLNGEVYPDGDVAVVDGIVNTTTGEHEYAAFCPNKKRWIPVSYEDWNNFEKYCDYPEFGTEEIPDEEIPDFGL
jgi:hypothetical protein